MKASGFQGPLNAREIKQLYRSGIFGPRQPCKPRQEATWRTIDEIFPLLKYEAEAPPLRFGETARFRVKAPLLATAGLLLAFVAITFFRSGSVAPRKVGQPTPAPQPAVVRTALR